MTTTNTWEERVGALDDAKCDAFAKVHGFDSDCMRFLRGTGMTGWCEDRIAFPVHDADRNVIGCRVQKHPRWEYRWFDGGEGGNKITALIFGDPAAAKRAYIFDAELDAVAFISVRGDHRQPGFLSEECVLVTRGTGNGGLVENLLPADCLAYAFKPNDQPGKNGKIAPGESWVRDVARYAGCRVNMVATPKPREGLAAWLRAGLTVADLEAAISEAVEVPAADLNSSPQVETDADDEVVPNPFPTAAFPPTFADMIREVSRTRHVPEELCGLLALGVMSASLGAGIKSRIFQALDTFSNVYLLGAVVSGEGKSIAAQPFIAPFCDLDEHQRNVWKMNVLPAAKTRAKILEDEIKVLMRKLRREENTASERAKFPEQIAAKEAELEQRLEDLIGPTLMVEDTTTEALQIVMEKNAETSFLYSSDGGDVVANMMGKYRKQNSLDESFYVKAWSGDSVRINRVGRKPISMEAARLGMLLLVQPDKVGRLLAEERLTDGGMMPRFLMAQISCPPTHVEVQVPEMSKEITLAYNQDITTMANTFRLATEPVSVVASDACKQIMAGYYNRVVDLRNGELTDLGPFAARYGEQACRLTLILHASLHLEKASTTEISGETALAAIEIVEWFVVQQQSLLMTVREKRRAGKIGKILCLGMGSPEGFPVREVLRRRLADNAHDAKSLLDAMVAAGQLTVEVTKTGGSPKTTYHAAKPDAQ